MQHNAFLKTLRPKLNGCHLLDDFLTAFFVKKKKKKGVPYDSVNNITALVQILIWPSQQEDIIRINDG